MGRRDFLTGCYSPLYIGLGINVEELKRKWGTIMSVYRKEHHKVARRSGPHEQFTPKWYCFDKLNEFLPFPKKIAKRKIPRHHKPDPDLEEVDQQEEEFEVDEFQDASLQPEECVPTAPQYPDLRRPDDCDAFGGKTGLGMIPRAKDLIFDLYCSLPGRSSAEIR